MNLLLKDFPDELAKELDDAARHLRPKSTRNEVILTILENFAHARREAKSPEDYVARSLASVAPATAGRES